MMRRKGEQENAWWHLNLELLWNGWDLSLLCLSETDVRELHVERSNMDCIQHHRRWFYRIWTMYWAPETFWP